MNAIQHRHSAAWVLVVAVIAGLVGRPTAACAADLQRGAAPVHTDRNGAGRSPGKPRPPVEFRLVTGEGLVSVGVPGDVVLEVHPRSGVQVLDLQVQGSGGLPVLGSARLATELTVAEPPAPGEAPRWQISLTPMEGGTQYLSGLLRFSVSGVAQAAPFSLPVQVNGPAAAKGAPVQKPEGRVLTTPSGELIDSMPAETTVR